MINTKTQFRYTDFWLSTADKTFVDISLQSRMQPRYLDYHFVKENNVVKTSILKPINDYVYNLYPAPSFLKYEDGYLYLRQKTHAEIWISTDPDGSLNVIDKAWMHQFYPSILKLENTDCFQTTFRFYNPWFVDANLDVQVINITDEYSPFSILEGTLAKVNTNDHIIEPNFIHFQFKHKNLENREYGKIDRESPMFDLKIKASLEDLDRFNMFYKTYKFIREPRRSNNVKN